ncbi:response regulator [SAR202 cluster bacterium JH702]|uniref:Response regulator n=1 Tax=Candidatus Lucifugimonas marina TaxID=3038979 RepID=A0ABD4XUK8_9CHLR|nr:response regulator [SAR202 cluster bacterium JH702]
MIPSKKILIVEDEPDVAMMLEISLSHMAGFRVLTVTDPLIAVDSAIEFAPDLILLDWMMPQKDGKSVLAELKNRSELTATPVIFLTASTNRTELEELARLSSGVVNKPFDLPSMIAELEVLLSLSEIVDQPTT